MIPGGLGKPFSYVSKVLEREYGPSFARLENCFPICRKLSSLLSHLALRRKRKKEGEWYWTMHWWNQVVEEVGHLESEI